MEIEKIHVASEMQAKNPQQWLRMRELFPQEKTGWIISSHEEFKKATSGVKAVIRTGEVTLFQCYSSCGRYFLRRAHREIWILT